MNSNRRLRWACCAALLALAACDEEGRDPLPDWSAGYERPIPDAGSDGGDALPPDVKSFGLVLPDSVNWPVRLGLRDDIDEPCTVAELDGQAGYAEGREIDCMMDVPELDLWVLGVQYDIVAPDNTCDFVLDSPYVFGDYATGIGPKRVAYTVEADGTFSGEVASANGKPVCEYDYSRLDPTLPNCCFGTYTLEITSRETGETTSERRSWGGQPGGCHYGAAYLEEDASFTPDGYPLAIITHCDADACVKAVRIAGVSDKFASNIALANYFDPEDHEGGAPAGLTGEFARPYYTADCLDDAGETIARIRLTVREWNEEAEYFARGNPDTTGVESGWGGGLIDIDDVSDWGAETPDGVTYAELPLPVRE